MLNVIRWFREKPLSDELCEVFDSCPELKKLGLNDEDPEDEYTYLRIVDVCNAFRGALLERGILWVASDVEKEIELISDSDHRTVEACTVKTKFAAKRRNEVLELGEAYGYAKDARSDKALAIAQTAAMKAQLKRLTMIYGKEDDPEVKRETLGPRESVRVASYQRRAWDAAVRDSGLSHDRISGEMSRIMGFDIFSENVPDLPRSDFDNCMKWLLAQQDLSGTWANAVNDLKSKRGPQPIVTAIDAKRKDEAHYGD